VVMAALACWVINCAARAARGMCCCSCCCSCCCCGPVQEVPPQRVLLEVHCTSAKQ
jgi:hypothetical protein